MYKRIYKSFMTIVGVTLLIFGCSKSDTNPILLHSRIDMSTSFFSADMYQSGLIFSTDGGTTYSEFPTPFHNGQVIKLKVKDLTLGRTLSAANDFLVFDWSASTPQPDNAASDNPQFVYNGAGSNFIVKISNAHCPFDHTVFSGLWTGDEGTIELDSSGVKLKSGAGTKDAIGFNPSTSNPNQITMYNILGNGNTENVVATFNQSTSAYDQTITIPVQVTAGGYTVAGSGSYDECRQTASITMSAIYIDSVSYADTVRGMKWISPGVYQDTITKVVKFKTQKQYNWTYSLTKNTVQPTYCTYNAASWAGAWTGKEGTVTQAYPPPTGTFPGSNDALTLTADPSNAPNGYILSNFFGDGTGVKVPIVFNPSTNLFDQNIAVTTTTTVEGGIASGHGSYDQCGNTISLSVVYDFGAGGKYVWTYSIAR
jgi:hypothetical protein